MKARKNMSEQNNGFSESYDLDGKDNTERGAEPDFEVKINLIEENTAPPKKERKPVRVSLGTFVCTVVALVLAAVMLTLTICSSYYKGEQAKLEAQYESILLSADSIGSFDELEILQGIFSTYSFKELDEDTIRTNILKAYVASTGDKYAVYYTDEEYAALSAQMSGKSQGIGINIIDSTVVIGGVEYKTLKVINVVKDSPAENNDLRVGDCIVAVGNAKENTTVSVLGYDMALKQLQGEKGTYAEFLAYRPDEGMTKEFNILRDTFQTASVMWERVDSDVCENVGLVKIVSFDRTTPSQLKTAVEELKAAGCEKFVFDVRYNPGGELTSIVAVLSYFLDEGDTVISMKDKFGNEKVYKAEPTVYSSSGACSIAAEDIGIYKDLDAVVICNDSTASAAELFVANFRDHGIGEVVGVTTYGKGTVQSTYPLYMFVSPDYTGKIPEGWIKLTMYMYYPPNGESYDGIGIVPDYEVEMSEESEKLNIYDIMGSKDDTQLVKAIDKYFKGE
ncbi:MAG: hypothetical protein E7677_01620 [Ruminococcaceae bacterium]|nr:hypothetical protein [Oscillospiraceae bacterium]